MLAILTIVAFGAWFALLYPVLRRALERRVPSLNVSPILPFLLVATSALLPFVYFVNRTDGIALLAQGLSDSNRVTIAITGLAGLYVLWRVALDKRVLRLPLAMPYLPFTMMLLFDLLSTGWSVVPSFTLYRVVELAVFFLATILLFDRTTILRSLPVLLGVFIVAWLVVVAPTYIENIAHGIIFSSAKNNVMPAMCFALLFYAFFVEPDRRRRLWQIGLAFPGLVIAGSASSTAAIFGFIPAIMLASRYGPARVAGVVLAVLAVLVFMMLTVNLADFPGLLHVVSVILQKPEAQLANATGRVSFWPAVIMATRDHYFGSGFAAADRFIQLLLPPGELRNLLGDNSLNLASAHNMFLSAWAGTGLAGIALGLTVLGSTIGWAMKLPLADRRFVLSFTFVIILNGLTVPGLFGAWNVDILAFIAVLAYARVAAGREAARTAAGAGLPVWRFPGIAAASASRSPP